MERTTAVKASFSVEAAWIFGISMIIIYMMIAFSFKLYSDVSDDILKTEIQDINAVKKFRLLQMGKDLIDIDGE